MKNKRLDSLDALRGFDMFWIIGGDFLIHKLAQSNQSPFFDFLSTQLRHPKWHGFTFYDLIFPLFIFVAGISIPFSVNSKLDKGITKKEITFSILKRMFILIFLGFVFNGFFQMNWDNLRYCSVLSRIAIASGFASLIYLWGKEKQLFTIIAFILISYWAAMSLIPVPGFATGDLSMQGNLASYIDRKLVPGRLIYGIHDPEGLVSNYPAIANGLLGVISGLWLRRLDLTETKKILYHLLAGFVCIALALLWNLYFPINKNLWTSSFVLVTSGISFLAMALFYWLIDVKGFNKFSFPFKLIGVNSILIYMTAGGGIFAFSHINNYFFRGLSKYLPVSYQGVFLAFTILIIELLFLLLCYRKKIFLKV